VTDPTGSTTELLAGVDRIAEKHHGELLGGPCRATRRRRARQWGIQGCGGTALWHGVYYAAKLKMKPLEGRKALVVISDGADMGSDAIEAAQGADTVVYAIRYVSPLGWVALWPMLRGRRALPRLAEETGGYAFSGAQRSLAGIVAQIEGELRSQYVLAFTPSAKNPGRGLRKLEVLVDRPEVTIRARKGVFSTR
jgi:VWFA-related protein